MKILIVAEKSSVALDIAKALLGVKAERGGFFRGKSSDGDELTISCAAGHFLELARPEAYDAVHGKQYGKWRLADLPIVPRAGWVFDEVPRPKAERNLTALHGLMRAHQGEEIINACDAGREGELIFLKILNSAGIDLAATKVSRMWMQEMTESAFREAFRNRQDRSKRAGLGEAGYSRDQADWLVGMNKTVLATKTLPRGAGDWKVWSIGRVQTPTLALIYERDRTIAFFKPQNFWEVAGVFDGVVAKADMDAYAESPDRAKLLGTPAIVEGRERKAFWRQNLAEAFAEAAKAPGNYTVTDTGAQRRQKPPLPFDLQEASKFFSKKKGWTAKESLEILQSLYEDLKVISYPRTDNRFFPDSAEMRAKVMDGLKAAHLWVQSAYPQTHLAAQTLQPDGTMSKSAAFRTTESDHYALHPLADTSGLARANRDQLFAWMAVTQACLMALDETAKFKVITRRWEQKDGTGPYAPCVFRTQRENCVYPGWTRWKKRDEDEGDAPSMPPLVRDQVISSTELCTLETKPPKPLDEATILDAMKYAGDTIDEGAENAEELMEAMKDRGLGTPATRAAIIETLLERGYIERNGKQLISTQNGRALVRALKKIDPMAVSARQTAELEFELKKMERGGSKFTRATFLDHVLAQIQSVAEAYRGTSTRLGEAERPELVDGTPTAVLCPKSGQPILDRGAAWESPGYPGVRLWKECFGRAWTAEDFRELLVAAGEGRPKTFENLKSRNGRVYSAPLGIDPQNSKIVIVEPEPTKVKGVKCPKSGKLLLDFGNYMETPAFPGVRFWKEALGRKWSPEDVVRVIQGIVDGNLAEFTDCVSKRTGKTYAARVTIDEAAKKVTCVFADRTAGRVA